MSTKKTIALIVLDGWGIGRKDETNPIYVVNPQVFSWLEENFPTTSLQASGIAVGLPWGEVGNSEVGHMTLGAGRVLYQHYPRITMAIRDQSFFANPVLKNLFEHARKNNSTVHFLGLLTKANVHASLDHLKALLQAAQKENIARIRLHLFADGKDSPPRTFENFIKELPLELVATIMGRYYAMDRNKSWQLTQLAYNTLTGDGGKLTDNFRDELKNIYSQKLTEEYLPPLKLIKDGIIKDGDAVFFFNYREDSIRQLAESFLDPSFDKFPTKKFQNLFIATMTKYEDKFNNPVAFPPQMIENPLGKILSDLGKTQLRIAETYKYAHVTYFFNGYREEPFKNEYRVLIPSLRGSRPEEHPELMAPSITDRLIEALSNQSFDFILVNYANPDTIGHSNNYHAALKAVSVINEQIGRVIKVGINEKTALIITSDHGNLESMINPMTGLPESQHDPSPVPLYLIAPEFQDRKFINYDNLANETIGSLADVAPTILELMGIEKPPEMTGRSLLESLI